MRSSYMFALRVFIVFCVIFSGRADAAAAGALEALIEQGKNHPIVTQALAEEEAYRSAMSIDFACQLRTLKDAAAENKDPDLVGGAIEALKEDLKYVNAFNKKVCPLHESIIGYPIKSNKMGSFIEGEQLKKGIIEMGIDLLTQHGITLVKGEVPDGYAIVQETITMLGSNNVSVYGSSKATALQMAILGLLIQAKKKETFAELDADLSVAMTYRATAHTEDVGQIKDIFRSLDSKSRFRIIDNKGYAFLTIHAGYIFGDLDCSQWMTSITGTPSRFTTSDLRKLAAELLTGEQNSSLFKKFRRVEVKDDGTGIEPGQMWHRGGHTALVIAVRADGALVNIATLGRNRNMPDMEGFGVQLFPYTPLDTNIFEVIS